MSGRNQMLDVFTAIGSAHAGAPLTPDALLERLKDPAFRARFNGPPPPEERIDLDDDAEAPAEQPETDASAKVAGFATQ